MVQTAPLSVNYHVTRMCNYKCGFCFHANSTKHYASLSDARIVLAKLKEAGMEKINFSGGEPFIPAIRKGKDTDKDGKECPARLRGIQGGWLGELIRYCHDDLKIDYISIVSNGSKIGGSWMHEYGEMVDMLAISCDSFDDATNQKHGRHDMRQGSERQSHVPGQIAKLCRDYNIQFKLNTVVTCENWNEDMSARVLDLSPSRWKVFRLLEIEGENTGPSAPNGRDATKLTPSDQEWQSFKDRHKHVPNVVFEDNDTMRDSYHILDEDLCFLNCAHGRKDKGTSLLETDVATAMAEKTFHNDQFRRRDGDFFRRVPGIPDIEDLAPESPCSDDDDSGVDMPDVTTAIDCTQREASKHPVCGSLVERIGTMRDTMRRSESVPSPRRAVRVVVVEGLDGVGKSTVVNHVSTARDAHHDTSSPEVVWQGDIRHVFDSANNKQIRRDFYTTANVLLGHTLSTDDTSRDRVWIVDRWWPSTVAYAHHDSTARSNIDWRGIIKSMFPVVDWDIHVVYLFCHDDIRSQRLVDRGQVITAEERALESAEMDTHYRACLDLQSREPLDHAIDTSTKSIADIVTEVCNKIDTWFVQEE